MFIDFCKHIYVGIVMGSLEGLHSLRILLRIKFLDKLILGGWEYRFLHSFVPLFGQEKLPREKGIGKRITYVATNDIIWGVKYKLDEDAIINDVCICWYS
ncbi:uncharacterized protein [Nicotiana tomentosiformis]|uniref:Uncharacterized protein isoform X3 n=1 Tax=Nicotiana tabacum TaxID=4097 RepID=A0A1S4BRM9_TOBAC|nr:uncharacterized protein LOC104115284 isoform X3 [Nicotiana tomentosiformis]XP_016491545.1 PREDICTED: uncharacterized protein LOC107811163 isoform X3 [Nicotiana tabacum]